MVGCENALFKIAAKKYLGYLMILQGGSHNALLKIAAKQYIRHFMGGS